MVPKHRQGCFLSTEPELSLHITGFGPKILGTGEKKRCSPGWLQDSFPLEGYSSEVTRSQSTMTTCQPMEGDLFQNMDLSLGQHIVRLNMVMSLMCGEAKGPIGLGRECGLPRGVHSGCPRNHQ